MILDYLNDQIYTITSEFIDGWFNIFMTNGLAQHYQLGESTLILWDIIKDFTTDSFPCSLCTYVEIKSRFRS